MGRVLSTPLFRWLLLATLIVLAAATVVVSRGAAQDAIARRMAIIDFMAEPSDDAKVPPEVSIGVFDGVRYYTTGTASDVELRIPTAQRLVGIELLDPDLPEALVHLRDVHFGDSEVTAASYDGSVTITAGNVHAQTNALLDNAARTKYLDGSSSELYTDASNRAPLSYALDRDSIVATADGSYVAGFFPKVIDGDIELVLAGVGRTHVKKDFPVIDEVVPGVSLPYPGMHFTSVQPDTQGLTYVIEGSGFTYRQDASG